MENSASINGKIFSFRVAAANSIAFFDLPADLFGDPGFLTNKFPFFWNYISVQ